MISTIYGLFSMFFVEIYKIFTLFFPDLWLYFHVFELKFTCYFQETKKPRKLILQVISIIFPWSAIPKFTGYIQGFVEIYKIFTWFFQITDYIYMFLHHIYMFLEQRFPCYFQKDQNAVNVPFPWKFTFTLYLHEIYMILL